jgi:hypothetical protein
VSQGFFALPVPNHRTDPPDHQDPVAIWHAKRGLIRGRHTSRGWRSEIRDHADVSYDILTPDNVLGWWPDPEPPPLFRVQCLRCDEHVDLPQRSSAHNPGLYLPVHERMPEGWTRDERRSVSYPWLCRTCSFVEEIK